MCLKKCLRESIRLAASIQIKNTIFCYIWKYFQSNYLCIYVDWDMKVSIEFFSRNDSKVVYWTLRYSIFIGRYSELYCAFYLNSWLKECVPVLVDHQPIIYVCGTLASSLFILQVYFNLVGATNQYCKRVEAKFYMHKAECP